MRAKLCLLLGCLVCQGFLAPGQTITNSPAVQFTVVPPYGSAGYLAGRALNVNPTNYRVAVYDYVAGGWYTRPTTNAPFSTIQANGNWSCYISDAQPYRFAAYLMPATNHPPLVNGTNAIPIQIEQQSVASLYLNHYAREIDFSGYKWDVKTSGGGLAGPGTNYFSSALNNVWVDSQGRLHLKITKDIVGGVTRWQCAELVSQRSFGYGTYRMSVDSRVDNLDPNVVLGYFTWTDDPAYTHREIDFEFSRWATPSDTNNAQYVVQPFDLAGNLKRFAVPAGLGTSTYSFKWETNRISYLSMKGYYYGGPQTNVFGSWLFNNAARIPQARDENARINLWLFNGQPPSDGQEAEVVINRFAFIPLQVPSPSLSSSARLTNGEPTLRLKGTAQVGYYLQGSTNLGVSPWSTLALLSSPDGQSAFIDTNAPNVKRRLYRAVVAPQ